MSEPDGIELALLHALKYEESIIKHVDTQKRWGINKEETKIVLKWMKLRMEDIKGRLNG